VSTKVPKSNRTDTLSDEHLTTAEICAELKVSRSTFYYWRQTGKAPQCFILPNGEVRIARAELKAWIDARREVA